MITGHDLIAIGYPADKRLGAALSRVREMETESRTREDIMAIMAGSVPNDPPKISRPSHGAPLTEAILVDTDEERQNVEVARARINELLRMPKVLRGALMPDTCPAGSSEATIPVGGAVEVDGAILPAAHSADICCSMFASFFAVDTAAGALLDNLQKVTRFGMGGRRPGERINHSVIEEPVWDNKFLGGLKDYAIKHMGDQGDGNHFAYLGRVGATEEFVASLRSNGYERHAAAIEKHLGRELRVLITHHGSRGLGAQLYKRGMDAAIKHTRKIADGIPTNGSWLDYDTEQGEAYWDALQYISRWTRANHAVIHEAFLHRSGVDAVTQIGNEHNFVWKRGNSFFHGKGATPAWQTDEGQPLLGLIPLHMAAPVLMVLGGNQDKFLSFAPHGAGRNCSRTAIHKQFRDGTGEVHESNVRNQIAQTTLGLDIRWYSGTPDVSESPIGYKNATRIKEQISRFELAQVVTEIQPEGCIMAGQMPKPWEAKYETKKQGRQREHRADRRTAHQDLRAGQWD